MWLIQEMVSDPVPQWFGLIQWCHPSLGSLKIDWLLLFLFYVHFLCNCTENVFLTAVTDEKTALGRLFSQLQFAFQLLYKLFFFLCHKCESCWGLFFSHWVDSTVSNFLFLVSHQSVALNWFRSLTPDLSTSCTKTEPNQPGVALLSLYDDVIWNRARRCLGFTSSCHCTSVKKKGRS